MKWEYKVSFFVPKDKTIGWPIQLNEHLDGFGKDGWELVSSFYDLDKDYHLHTWELIFKRPLLSES